jgi:hypothetical protein
MKMTHFWDLRHVVTLKLTMVPEVLTGSIMEAMTLVMESQSF